MFVDRGENGELRVGIRHLSSQRWREAPNLYLALGETTDPLMVLATVSQAVATRTLFTVFHRPGLGSGSFIVGVNRYMECAKSLCSIGLRFSMRFEVEGHLQRRCNGSIIEVGDVSNRWKDSKWQCLKVMWDEFATIARPERVSPWEIDPVDTNTERRYEKQVQAKKARKPKSIHHSSVEANNMVDVLPNIPNEEQDLTQNWWLDPLMPSRQNWNQNDDNWIQQMLDDEPLEWDEIVCNQFPTARSPTIHFSELHGERVSKLNSEDSVQGETRKRKATSVGDAESGNGKEPGFDDRQVKCRIEPSQGGADSNSDQTHYSSASEGELSTGQFNQDSPPAEGTENAIDRPFISRAWSQISGFLLHQLKTYTAR